MTPRNSVPGRLSILRASSSVSPGDCTPTRPPPVSISMIALTLQPADTAAAEMPSTVAEESAATVTVERPDFTSSVSRRSLGAPTML